MSSTKNPRELLDAFVGADGPPAVLFLEMAAKYGLPIKDGAVPLSTELHVRLTDWKVLFLDPSKAGFPGAIGFRRNDTFHYSAFGLWARQPYGGEKGYITVGDPLRSSKYGPETVGKDTAVTVSFQLNFALMTMIPVVARLRSQFRFGRSSAK